MSRNRHLKITVSGVRGVVGETFSPRLAADFASAFGEFVGKGLVVVGRDTRSSGELFEHAVCAGLMAVGCQVVLLGIVPTPTLQIAVKQLGASGGVAITASHNSVEWNALKFIGANAMFMDSSSGAELLDVYNQPDSNYVEESQYHPVKRMTQAFQQHQELIFNVIDRELIRNAHLKVAIDCCNGVGAIYSVPFLEALGVETVPLFQDPGIPFQRPPEPVPEHLGALADLVVREHCDIGFAQDPDGDRISLVDETGVPLGVQNSLLPAAEHLLRKASAPGVIVANIQTTRAVEELAAKYHFRVVYSPVGEVNVTDSMKAHQALFGLEGSSGGLITPAVHTCRDSFTAMALTLEFLAQTRLSLRELIGGIPHYDSATRKVPTPAQQAVDALRSISARYQDKSPVLVDGVRIDFGDSWVLLRQSNTEAVLRILAEADSPEKAEALANRFECEFQECCQNSTK